MSAERRPTRLENLPTVLDSDEAMSVLRCGEKKLSLLVNTGRLRRLAYSSNPWLFDARELRDFLRRESVVAEAGKGVTT
jgi:hypothetical protein